MANQTFSQKWTNSEQIEQIPMGKFSRISSPGRTNSEQDTTNLRRNVMLGSTSLVNMSRTVPKHNS
nr:CFF_HP1_G0028760.mRNA.1.CDS.1 [Saccharomyces cerevisiae]